MTQTPTDHSADQRRIARNTMSLYVRTVVTMLINLYTSRLVLEALGVDDFGIYGVVGGVVGMFTIISGSMSGSISRFLTFHLTPGNVNLLRKVFSTSINIQVVIGIIVVIIGEFAGIWAINSKLNIPPDRIVAAHWVLQCSLLAFVASLLGVPYNACIIANERMGVFAFMNILEVCLKLALALLLFVSPTDALITYSAGIFLIAVTMRVIYGIYCRRKFEECHYEYSLSDRKLVKDMAAFAWWGLFGNSAWVLNTQGISIIINIFFGVALNAARGIAGQVEGVVVNFVNNFTTALNPQITKSFASQDLEYTFSLICKGTKYAFFLLLFLIIPIEFETEAILNIWLVDVPPYSALFLRLALIGAMMNLYGSPSFTAIMATGNIRNYQIVVTVIGCLVFPLSWIAYKIGFPVETSYYIFIFIYLILIYVRLWFVRRLIGLPISRFLRLTVVPSLTVGTLSLIVPALIVWSLEPSFVRLVLLTVASTVFTATIIGLFGMNRNERSTMIHKLKSYNHRFHHI